jgi:hypothetical protein
MKCQFSLDDMIEACLNHLAHCRISTDNIDEYYEQANMSLAQTFSSIPKLNAFVL